MNVPVILRRRRLQYGGGVAPFSPLSLFASGEEGVWYEPSTTTAFLSTTDLTPCGYGDACGFLLDKSQGAGYSGGSFTGLVELVAGGEFNDPADVSEWTDAGSGGSISWNPLGYIDLNVPASANVSLRQAVTVTPGSWVFYSFDIISIVGAGNNIQYRIGDTTGGSQIILATATGTGTVSRFFQVPVGVSTLHLTFNETTEGTVTLDNISVRELPGNHATQSNADSRPTLARVPEGGRRNLFERTEEFDNAYWAKSAASISANATTAPDGTTTADELIEDSSTGLHLVDKTTGITASNTDIAVSIYAKQNTRRYFSIVMYSTSGQWTMTTFDLQSGSVTEERNNNSTFGFTSLTSSIVDDGDGWYRCIVEVTQVSNTIRPRFFTSNTGTPYADTTYNSTVGGPSYTGDGTSGVYIWGAQFEAGSSATAYQKVIDEYDVTEAGVDSLDYLSFDGTDDGMATAAIDFTGTDEMSVFAGVEKLSETAQGFILELGSGGQNGSFIAQVNSTTTEDYYAHSRGTASFNANQRVASDDSQPAQAVYTALHDISGDSTIMRINASEIGEATGDKGAGNFGNYPLNIGARNNAASLWFGGNLYGLIVRGASSTTSEINQTETYLANRSGVVI